MYVRRYLHFWIKSVWPKWLKILSPSRQICAYFTSPQVCIGPVAKSNPNKYMEHTAGEKRMSGHPDYHHLK